MDGETLCWGHTPTDYCVTALKTSITVDVTTPIATVTSGSSISTMGIGAFSGLGGYMTLGLGVKAKPNVSNVNDNEALIAKDSESHSPHTVGNIFSYRIDIGFLVGSEGKNVRSESIDWPAPPEEIGKSASDTELFPVLNDKCQLS